MVGTTISHYKVLEKIGEGGMREVYRAEGVLMASLRAQPLKPSGEFDRG